MAILLKRDVERMKQKRYVGTFHSIDNVLVKITELKSLGYTSDEILAVSNLQDDDRMLEDQTDIVLASKETDGFLARVKYFFTNDQPAKDAFELLTPKTESSARTISIDSALINLLEAHRLEQDKLKDMNAPFYVDEGFIFAGSEGYPKTMNVIANRMHRLLSRSGINRRLTPHSMRHTHTALLIEANVHIKEIQERLGHSNINTTFSIYAHLTKDVKKEASNKFSDLMKDLSNDLIL